MTEPRQVRIAMPWGPIALISFAVLWGAGMVFLIFALAPAGVF